MVTASALAIMEPLTEATQAHFKPKHLADRDFLQIELWVDPETSKHRFIVQARAYVPFNGVLIRGNTQDDIKALNGQEMQPYRMGPSIEATKGWVERVPEKRELGFGRWNLAATDFTALVIHYSWPEERLLFKSEEARIIYQSLLLRFHRQSANAIRAARFKVEKAVPGLPADFIDHPDSPLLRHQYVPLVNSLHTDYALFMEQGTCKTSTVIARICLEAGRKRAGRIPGIKPTIYRVLIVCPNQVRQNWVNEFHNFAVTPGKVTVIKGEPATRVRRQVDGTSEEEQYAWGACVIGYDTFEPTLESLLRTPWDLIVLDESHFIKNSRTVRFKAVSELLERGHVRHRMILTGTPIANTAMDLWSQLETLGSGLSGFQTYAGFRGFHGKFRKGEDGAGNSIQQLEAIKHIPLIQERLARLSFMITKAEAGFDLPDRVYDIHEVEMTKTQWEYYNQVKEELALELEGILADDSKRMSADHVLTKLLRLAQITSGHVTWDAQIDTDGTVLKPKVVEDIAGGNPKVDATIYLITQEGRDPKGKTIVWCCFVHDIVAVERALAAAGVKAVSYYGATSEAQREQAVDSFNNDPDCKVMVANPATAGEGLNLLGYDKLDPERLDTYCDHEIFFSQNWSAVQRSQAEARAHRKGTRTNVRITDLCVLDTIDEEIRSKVTAKRAAALAIQDVREILKRVLQ